jgi:hypothetical protein
LQRYCNASLVGSLELVKDERRKLTNIVKISIEVR